MGLTDWIGSFDRASTHDLSNNLEQAYEAALLIQSLELEYYNDRPVRPELELSIPKSAKALMLRRFRAALQVAQENDGRPNPPQTQDSPPHPPLPLPLPPRPVQGRWR